MLITPPLQPDQNLGLLSAFLQCQLPKKTVSRPLRCRRTETWGRIESLGDLLCADDGPREADSSLVLKKNADSLLYDKWCSSPLTMTKAEYSELYASHFPTKGKLLHLVNIRETEEGEFKYKAVLFVPDIAHDSPADPTHVSDDISTNFKFYVARIPCSMVVPSMLPEYLSFLKGIVDVERVPDEPSEQSERLDKIIQQLTFAAIERFLQIALDDPDEFKPKYEAGTAHGDCIAKKGQYFRFWKSFGMEIKLGVVEDSLNRGRLVKLLRYKSSKCNDKIVSLDLYLRNMKVGQEAIFYATGIKELLEKFTFLETVTKNDYEVLFFPESFDEKLCRLYVSKVVGYKFCNALVSKVDVAAKVEEAASEKDNAAAPKVAANVGEATS